MKKILLYVIFLAFSVVPAVAQTAKSVLDKCAQTLSAQQGVEAQFSMESAQYGNASGNIAIKGRRFHATTGAAAMWFDGKTQWTYLKKNDEVSVTTPTEEQLQALNPYNFINMYKKGFSYTMTKSGGSYIVHLKADDAKRRIQEMFITIDQKSYAPSEVKMRQGQRWTKFTISGLHTANLADSRFVFNKSDYPSAEVIDLR